MIEVVVAALLLTTVAAGALSAFNNAARWASPPEATAANIARGQLEQLNESVRQDTWNQAVNTLNPGTYNSVVNIDGRDYNQTYVVTSVKLDGVNEAYRRVVVTETWTG